MESDDLETNNLFGIFDWKEGVFFLIGISLVGGAVQGAILPRSRIVAIPNSTLPIVLATAHFNILWVGCLNICMKAQWTSCTYQRFSFACVFSWSDLCFYIPYDNLYLYIFAWYSRIFRVPIKYANIGNPAVTFEKNLTDLRWSTHSLRHFGGFLLRVCTRNTLEVKHLAGDPQVLPRTWYTCVTYVFTVIWRGYLSGILADGDEFDLPFL